MSRKKAKQQGDTVIKMKGKKKQKKQTLGAISGLKFTSYGIEAAHYIENGNCSFTKTGRPKIYMTYNLMFLIKQLCIEIPNKEWGIYFAGKKVDNKGTLEFHLSDYLWTEQETTPVHTQFIKNKRRYSYTDDVRKLFAKKNNLKVEDCVAGVVHSHHSMSPTPSNEDKEQSCTSGEFAIIVANNGNFTAWAKKQLPCGHWVLQKIDQIHFEGETPEIEVSYSVDKTSNEQNKMGVAVSVKFCNLKKKGIDIKLCRNEKRKVNNRSLGSFGMTYGNSYGSNGHGEFGGFNDYARGSHPYPYTRQQQPSLFETTIDETKWNAGMNEKLANQINTQKGITGQGIDDDDEDDEEIASLAVEDDYMNFFEQYPNNEYELDENLVISDNLQLWQVIHRLFNNAEQNAGIGVQEMKNIKDYIVDFLIEITSTNKNYNPDLLISAKKTYLKGFKKLLLQTTRKGETAIDLMLTDIALETGVI